MFSNLILVAHFVAPDELGLRIGHWDHWDGFDIRKAEFMCEEQQVVFFEGVHFLTKLIFNTTKENY